MELYFCKQGKTINIDLDPIPNGSKGSVILYTLQFPGNIDYQTRWVRSTIPPFI
ncbi:MAG: hypothetical protein ACMUIU_08270 [bacterium]